MITMLEFLESIVPTAIFDIRRDGTIVENTQHLIEQCHPGTTGMQLLTLEENEAEARIPYAQSNRALHGLMHGGCYFTVGDTLTAVMCMFHVTDPAERMLTRDASIRYLRPIDRETVTARARLSSREGNQLSFVCDFFNEAGKRAAQAKYRYVLAKIA